MQLYVDRTPDRTPASTGLRWPCSRCAPGDRSCWAAGSLPYAWRMPSFRVTVTIGALRPGVQPEAVLPFAAAAAAQRAVVEASDLAVVRGSARIIVRFTADDVGRGWQIGRAVVDDLRSVADPQTWAVTLRDGGRWYPVHPPDLGEPSD